MFQGLEHPLYSSINVSFVLLHYGEIGFLKQLAKSLKNLNNSEQMRLSFFKPSVWISMIMLMFLPVFLFSLSFAQEISRAEIQNYFVHHSGNSTRTPHWQENYQGKQVAWEGVVYKIKRRPKSFRVEIMVKVLDDALLYDTIVVLEGHTTFDSGIRKHVPIRFKGKIIHGVDVLGVKQVRVLAPNPEAIKIKPLSGT